MHIESMKDEQEDLGNAWLVLILGTISLVLSLFPLLLFIGIFISLGTGLAALVLAGNGHNLYKANKERFTLSSYKRLRKGRNRAIAGLIITGIWIIVWALNYGKDGLN